MALHLYNPADGTLQDIDEGRRAEYNLMLNILIELRVHTIYLQAIAVGTVDDQPEQLRIDVTNDPSSLHQ